MSAAPRLPGLDALRGIAALLVVGLHTHAVFGGFPDWFSKGYLAVDFFFMLSGYVMARAYEPRLEQGFGAARFFAARYRRIWPTMVVGAVLGIPLLAARVDDPWLFAPIFLANLALLPFPFDDELFPLNVPAWSIFYELFANYVHGTLVWRWRRRALVAAIVAAALLVGFAAAAHGTLDLGARPGTFFPGFVRALLTYLIGVALWRWWRDRPAWSIPAPVAFAAMPLIVVASAALGSASWLFDLAFVMIACPLLIAGGLQLSRPSRLAALSGALSFPLYAVHYPVLLLGKSFHLGAVGSALATIGIAAAVAAWTARGGLRVDRSGKAESE